MLHGCRRIGQTRHMALYEWTAAEPSLGSLQMLPEVVLYSLLHGQDCFHPQDLGQIHDMVMHEAE